MSPLQQILSCEYPTCLLEPVPLTLGDFGWKQEDHEPEGEWIVDWGTFASRKKNVEAGNAGCVGKKADSPAEG